MNAIAMSHAKIDKLRNKLFKLKSPADLDARRGGGLGARRGGGARGARGGAARGDRAPPPRRGGRGAPRGSTRPPRGRRVRSPDQPTELRKPGNRTALMLPYYIITFLSSYSLILLPVDK